MTQNMVYTLSEINAISFNGFNYEIPETTINLIKSLAQQVGSPAYIKTPIFNKRENIGNDGHLKTNKKHRRNNNNREEISKNEWLDIKTSKISKIEIKNEFETQIDNLHLSLNKLSDKTFLLMREKIINTINVIINSDNELTETENNKLGFTIYDILSNNKFYSKIYSDLFTDLINEYSYLKTILDDSFASYLEQFNNLEFVEPNEDYDRFCELNKINEKRKSKTLFFLNLAFNGVIPLESIGNLLQNLLQLTFDLIVIENKNQEVDDITEHVALLFAKDFITKIKTIPNYDGKKYMVNGLSFEDLIEKIAKSKPKDYKSLSTKTRFKYMDLNEM
jgi:hypothetical protein